MTDQDRPPVSPASDSAGREGRRIPPLVWIVIFILVAWLAWAWVQRGGTDRTPQGGTMPSAAEGPSYMPAAPASGSAPATPPGTVNGPQQPGRK
jgi:hypothetical protein